MVSILVTITLFFSGTNPSADEYVRLRQAGLAEYQMGQYAKSEESIRKALDLAQTINNEDDVALNYSVLGDIRQAERRLVDAEKDYRNAISLLSPHRESSYAAAIVWRHLASALTADARYDEALAALKEASRLVSKSSVEDPGLNAQILNNLGFVYYNQKKIAKSEGLFLRAAALQFTASNPLDVDLWQILNNLGRVYQSTQQYAKAEDAYKHALQLAEVRQGQTHPNLSLVLDNLGFLYVRSNRCQEAESQFQRSLAILNHSRVSFDSIFMMRTLYGLGETYRRENDAIRAEGMLAGASEIARRRVLAVEMPEALAVIDTYVQVLQDLSHFAEAQRFQMEAQRMRASMAYTVPLGNLK
jgi:tetratricopeptide (TPR) repeat protein